MKKFHVIAILTLIMVVTLTLAGCSNKNPLEDYEEQGYIISVYYDTNSGSLVGGPNNTLVDLFNPNNYEKDASGNVSIKLLEPTSSLRPSGSVDDISLTKQGYFFAGWYKERVLATNSEGEVVDWNDQPLEEIEGRYFLKDSNGETLGYPKCVSYNGYWDFENDRIVTNGEEKLTMTLYAGWVPYYEFNYYHNLNGSWEKYSTTTFDYKTTHAEGSTSVDHDTIFMPKYEDGAMQYQARYANGSIYTFPGVENYTFNSAYLDEACENQIVDTLKHSGSLDLATGVASNRVQNVYVKFDEGTIYHITTAEQFVKHANSKGTYYIEADLDFTDLTWPSALMYNEFTGTINGNNHTFTNINAKFNSKSASVGGLFGRLSSDACIIDLTLNNVTYDYVTTGMTGNGYYGLIAGDIDENATLSINLTGVNSLRIGEISLRDTSLINIVANGTKTGIIYDTATIKLFIYGNEMYGTDDYTYTVDPESVSVDTATGNVLLTVTSMKKYKQAQFEITIGG